MAWIEVNGSQRSLDFEWKYIMNVRLVPWQLYGRLCQSAFYVKQSAYYIVTFESLLEFACILS